jgi:hypothetical protein
MLHILVTLTCSHHFDNYEVKLSAFDYAFQSVQHECAKPSDQQSLLTNNLVVNTNEISKRLDS